MRGIGLFGSSKTIQFTKNSKCSPSLPSSTAVTDLARRFPEKSGDNWCGSHQVLAKSCFNNSAAWGHFQQTAKEVGIERTVLATKKDLILVF